MIKHLFGLKKKIFSIQRESCLLAIIKEQDLNKGSGRFLAIQAANLLSEPKRTEELKKIGNVRKEELEIPDQECEV
ncbi:MAG: hypothetical protein WC933_03410 [Candidatus Paceibacterota bacterium]|jgi:hypothetical protein